MWLWTSNCARFSCCCPTATARRGRKYLADADPAIHAAALRSRGAWIPGLVDPGANGRDQTDGYRLLQRYRDLGLCLEGVTNPVESGILHVYERMSSGRLKVFASLPKYLDERRLYRRDERGQIVSERDQLQDAVRCLVTGLSRMRTQIVKPPKPLRTPLDFRGEHSWMAH